METKNETINNDDVVIEKADKLLKEVSDLFIGRENSAFICGFNINDKGYSCHIGKGLDILAQYLVCLNNPNLEVAKRALYLILKDEYENVKL